MATTNAIRRWAAGSTNVALFKSGIIRYPALTNPGYALVVANEPVSALVTLWAALLQGDGTTVMTEIFADTVTGGEPFTLPGGYESREFQVQIETAGPVQGFLMAGDLEDLH